MFTPTRKSNYDEDYELDNIYNDEELDRTNPDSSIWYT